METKICKKCLKTKPIEDFRKTYDKRVDKTYTRKDCKECETKYRHENSERYKEHSKRHYAEKTEYYKERNHINEAKNRDRRNQQRRDKRKTDIGFKLKSTIHRRLLDTLKNRKNHTVDYVGCSMETVKQWLEFNFEEDMTWENHGIIWDIDHVIPVAKFDFNEENKEELSTICFSWKNISPLYSQLNRSKGDKIDIEQLKKHNQRLIEFNNLKCIENIELLNQHIDKWLNCDTAKLRETP